MSENKSNLTDKQLKDIERVEDKYRPKISIEENKVNILNQKIAKLASEKEVIQEKINKINREKRRKITDIKDSERLKKYKKIDIKVDDVYNITLDSEYKQFGSYRISSKLKTVMSIKIDSETPTQYRLRVSFSENVTLYCSYRYTQNTRNMFCNMKQLNLKDFLADNSYQFKREVNISNLVD